MDDLLRTAGRILSQSLNQPVALRCERTWDGAKSIVLRCSLQGTVSSDPPSVIVKQSKHGAILEDWAASLFLGQLAHEPPLAPRCYGGDRAAQMIVLEDLGDGEGPSALDLVLGADPGRATDALVERLRLLGELHAATAGRGDAFARIRQALGPARPVKPLYKDPWSDARGGALSEQDRQQAVREYRSNLQVLGLLPPDAVDEEIDRVTLRVEGDPGPFLALCQGDVNEPGGCIRCRGRLRLYDFDCTGLRHALLEGLAGRLTWGAAARIPADVVRAMEAAYRQALMVGCAAARDETIYRCALAEAAARWHVFHVTWRLLTALERDYPRGITRLRQQLLAWLDGFVAIVEECGHMTALGVSARGLAARLRRQWPPDVVELPLYPAFRRCAP
jgi:hypothetical protein